MLVIKRRLWIIIVLFIVLLTYSVLKISIPTQTRLIETSSGDLLNKSVQSKAALVSELKDIKEKIGRLEEIGGQFGNSDFKVYSAEETANLLHYYQELRTVLEYLNRGYIVEIKDWRGYPLEEEGKKPYRREEAFRILTELEKTDLPSSFLSDFRVYLLPSGVPEISGLGGAGFAMISAPDIMDRSVEQLRVTLLHELGHHLHSRFMPSPTIKSNFLWDNYLRIRGGEWQGSGAVNTSAWSNSSEETFAEDFRLIIGKNQQYYGDISLGDPRSNPEIAVKLKEFFFSLQSQPISESSKSPWIPEGLQFWLDSHIFIVVGWSVIMVGIIIILNNNKSNSIQFAN